MSRKIRNSIERFNFEPSTIISGKYQILDKLGQGWEGEVYKIKETATGIVRAAKFFKPHRNARNLPAKHYAKKLHKLRTCPILIKYITQDTMEFKGQKITYLVSDYIEGMTLDRFLKSQRGKKLSPLQAILLLHSLVKGLEDIHDLGEYHGDLHTDNIIVQKYGLGFELKVLDMFNWGAPRSQDFKDDLCDSIKVFHESLGGRQQYGKLPSEIKFICGGLRKDLITKRFKNISQLRCHLEKLRWQ